MLWVQGCDLGCPGCFNPATHAASGVSRPVDAVAEQVLAALTDDHAGVTFSGGEPFQQAEATAELADRLRAARPGAHLMAFSGYRLEDLRGPAAPPGAADLLATLDALVDGPFDPRRARARPWRASTNQRLWIIGRPLPTCAFEAAPPEAELHLAADGAVLLSGYPDAGLRALVRQMGGDPRDDG